MLIKNIKHLRKLAKEYFKTVRDDIDLERYMSPRNFAEFEVDDFIDWIEIEKIDKKEIK